MECAPFTSADITGLLADWLDEGQQAALQKNGQLDFAVTLVGNLRLRASAFQQRQGTSLALRLLPTQCPTLERLETPSVLPELLRSENGLILVTGATGSGKSTTLAAMVAWLNQHVDGHILTLEDPIEYVYTSQRCLIQQREVGLHCTSFAAGLRAALREDPDVILLGELRDSETIRLALTAAETGHLVLATLHTRGAAQAIERLIDTFPAQEKDPVRSQLAGSLRAVLSQKLESDKQEGRVALFELLINTPAAGNLIREGKSHQLPHVIQTGQQVGMMTFSQSLQQRQAQGRL
ncbi:pilus retraction protein PilT [Citrobacter amalonaticus Y19]|uniref:Pilus retraction protein PilT n=2 Tax=Citrobacter amalonaticus TaxID=35703 RepID=A0A0F6RI80_CITAM|nr:pilus retraction protein PilT [Citrobacter amalonaticus Y19]